MVDDYHRNTGEGADLYSAGRTRGCGGSGLWRDGKLYSSINFRNTRSLANGPIRVMFELSLGIKNNAGSVSMVDLQRGVRRTWEPLQQEGFLGCAVIAAPGTFVDSPSADGNYLVIAKLPTQGPAVYYAGSAWDKAGEIATAAEWDGYLARGVSTADTGRRGLLELTCPVETR